MTAGRTRIAPLLAAALLAAGCFNSHNPGYFPHYLPGGPIEQSHAKPRFGVFRDFDPKAAKIDVTPQNATAPLGAQIVLVATVCDKDGQPRRSRRVEWVLDGPGNIIEVDEAGVYAGRGYKVDNKYAVTYTNYGSHTITRGNDDPKDDVEIEPGQTFCVISSAVPGETTVTAYAPGVFNWERGRVVAKVAWGEGRFSFPASAVVRAGGEHTLSTTVTHFEQDGPAHPTYRVRYKVLEADDGPAAVLVPRAGAGTSGSQSGTSAKQTEADVDTNGAAAVRLVQPTPRTGKTRVAVEIVKPAESGAGPGTVVSRRETVVEWAAPDVKLDVAAPPVAGLTAVVPVTVSLANVGPVDARESRVRVTLSDGATLDRSEPPPVKQEAGTLVFDLPALAARQRQTVELKVKPARVGPFTAAAEVTTADGLSAGRDATTRVEQGRLGVLVEAPPVALAGERIPVRVAVTNPAGTPAGNVTVWARFDDGLKHASGMNPVELAAGTVAPGQTKLLDLPLTAKATGRFKVQATATADGNVTAAADPVTLDVRRAELKVAVAGPRLAYLDQEFAWTVTVSNAGDAPVGNATVRATLPPEVRLKDAGGAKVGAGSVEWKLDALPAGDRRELKLTVEAAKLTDKATVAVVAQADATGGDAKPVGDPVEAKAEAAVAVIGAPAVVLELISPTAPVEVGKRATYTIRVRNQGTLAARNVVVAAFAPEELRLTRGGGKADGRIEAGGKMAFPVLDELRPGEAATYTVEAEAALAGDARVRAEVRAEHLKQPLREEQATRVVGR